MQRIIDIWLEVYFTEPILLILLLLTLIVFVVRRRSLPAFRWLPFYIALFLLVFLGDYAYNILVYPNEQERFQKYQRELNFYTTVLELLVFVSLIDSSLRIPALKRTLRLLTVISLLTFLGIYIFTHVNRGYISYSDLNTIYIIELATLLCSSVFFFIQLFREPPVANLRALPEFWIAIGLSFYCLCTLPLTIANSYFFTSSRGLIYVNLFSIIYVFYIILFSLIIRSMVCQRPETIS
jgi:hypothetical protein